jgi:hypothetical protein
MNNTYQAPSESCNDKEKKSFWVKVVTDQIASQMGAEKFCQQHQLNFSSFHYWKYRKFKLLTNNSNNFSKNRNRKRNKDIAKFIPLEITPDGSHKNQIVDIQSKEVVIIFKNGRKIIIPLVITEPNLLLLIKTVGELLC